MLVRGQRPERRAETAADAQAESACCAVRAVGAWAGDVLPGVVAAAAEFLAGASGPAADAEGVVVVVLRGGVRVECYGVDGGCEVVVAEAEGVGVGEGEVREDGGEEVGEGGGGEFEH